MSDEGVNPVSVGTSGEDGTGREAVFVGIRHCNAVGTAIPDRETDAVKGLSVGREEYDAVEFAHGVIFLSLEEVIVVTEL